MNELADAIGHIVMHYVRLTEVARRERDEANDYAATLERRIKILEAKDNVLCTNVSALA